MDCTYLYATPLLKCTNTCGPRLKSLGYKAGGSAGWWPLIQAISNVYEYKKG